MGTAPSTFHVLHGKRINGNLEKINKLCQLHGNFPDNVGMLTESALCWTVIRKRDCPTWNPPGGD